MAPGPLLTRRRLAAELELLALDAEAHRHRRRLLAAADVAALEADVALLAARRDRLAGAPAGTRPLTPHERRARVHFADLEAEVDLTAGRLADAMLDARAEVADELGTWLEAALDDDVAGLPIADLPGIGDPDPRRRVDAVMAAVTDPATPLPLGRDIVPVLTSTARAELEAAAHDGYRRVLSEAAAQAVTVDDVPGLDTTLLAADLDRSARHLAAEPAVHARDLMAARYADLARDIDPFTIPDELRAAEVLGSTARMTDAARPEVHKAHGLGRQFAADDTPLAPAYVYASELLDRSTCSPCGRIDGRRYATIDEARADYPDGRYRKCEGGRRCRGTLVYVWPDEADPTVDGTLPANPDDDAPDIDDDGAPIEPGPPPAPAPAAGVVPIGPGLPVPADPPRLDLTRDERAALEREAKLAARRDAAAAVRQAEADDLATLVAEGWTEEAVAEAARDLKHYRARARAEAARLADEVNVLIEATGDATRLGPPPTAITRRIGPKGRERTEVRRVDAEGNPYLGGDWDWFDALSEPERKRLRRQWISPDSTTKPDQLAQVYQDTYGDRTVDAALGRWLELTRQHDAARALARGKLPSDRAYGTTFDVDTLLADSPFDAATLFGSDTATAVRRVLERYDDEAADFAQREAADAALDTLGPSPWNMPEADYARELNALESLPMPDPLVDFDAELGRPRYPDDFELALARHAELVPPEFAEADLAPRDLHRAIMEWADRAGLRTPDIEAFAQG